MYIIQALEDEDKMTPEQLAIKNVGKQDPKRHLEEKVDTLMSANIIQCLGSMLDTVVFKWWLLKACKLKKQKQTGLPNFIIQNISDFNESYFVHSSCKYYL